VGESLREAAVQLEEMRLSVLEGANDSSRRKIKEGSLIRFRCQGDQVLTRVTGVNRYATFEEMFDHQDVASVNPTATRAEQLANIRQIYPPEREALGVVAIGIELVDPPRPA
jgi:ASC-1-like (ASCH) protein